MEQAHAERPPGFAVLGGEGCHRTGIGHAREEPGVVYGRAESKHILASTRFDQLPCFASRLVTGADPFHFAMGREATLQLIGRDVG